jgi:hypothetical protein
MILAVVPARSYVLTVCQLDGLPQPVPRCPGLANGSSVLILAHAALLLFAAGLPIVWKPVIVVWECTLALLTSRIPSNGYPQSSETDQWPGDTQMHERLSRVPL